ncbi:MarR family winged helix-turn-helix transcriptional regulator [Celeribacter neptunius]|uniref:DNA-binding transcriptional regulator, MarR family n=1 Tax=Celeribacter neptunius TaxID=588602 RepID=A0A1I3JN60_9RHOB|nr:MarR family winged helix-turn-helix transcriptional regulator [Celeribacter neptunius]SFI61335.1 DNA-binding transcriptional regulator, MarR family [Celeribacter neptunius]
MTPTDTDPQFHRSRSEGYLVNHMARLFARAIQDGIKPLGLSTGTFPVMLALWEKEGRTQRELVAELGVEQATMANTLARMERDGLITRRAHDRDARVQTVWLTEQARQLQAPAIQAAQEVNIAATRGMSAAERATLMSLITRAIDNLSES